MFYLRAVLSLVEATCVSKSANGEKGKVREESLLTVCRDSRLARVAAGDDDRVSKTD